MSLLIAVALRSSAILLAGLGLHALIRKRAAAVRHLVLAGAIGAAAAVVPLSLVLPSWLVVPSWDASASAARTSPRSPETRIPPHVASTGAADTAHRATLKPTAVTWPDVAVAVWFAGFLATAVMLVAGALRLKRTASRARLVDDVRWLEITAAVAGAYGLRRRIRVLHADTRHLLATWGVFRPCVIVPSHAQDWSEDRIHVVLCHELAHVRRLDWLVQSAAEAFRTVLWFNPLLWIACTRLRRESEHACDDLVLGRGVAAHDYATHLLELAHECRLSPGTPMPALPMARRSTLERRIADMLNPRIDRKAPTIRSIAVPFALLLAVTVPTASIHARQAGPAMLSGTVYDVTGAVMPGVTLTLEDVTQATHDAVADFAGRFAFSNVQPGHYTLQASLPGFRTMRQEFDLNTRRDWDRAITLQVGDLKETVTVSATRLAAQVTPAAGSPQRIRVGGNVRQPKKTVDVRPIYPPSMQQAGREGDVPIEAIIGPDGTVTSVRVLSAQVHPDFAIAAVDAVRQWQFTPTLLNGSPVEVVIRVTVAFKLSE